MQRMVKLMYEYFMENENGEGSKHPHREDSSNSKKEEERSLKANGGKPPPSPPPSSSSSSAVSSSSKSTTKTHTHTHSKIPKGKTLLLKLDIKFKIPTYNGEFNAEKIDNWIRQLEVYCSIQNLQEDDIKIQLASLRLEGAVLIWWEAKTQEEM